MAVSIVRGPDGRKHEVQHPEGIASSQIVKYAQRQISSAANAEDGFIVDVGKGLFAGGSQAAVSSAAGVTQWMGQSLGSDSLLQAAEDMRQFGEGVADDIGLDEDFRQSFFGQVVQGLGQVPVTIAAGAAGFAAAGPVGAFGAAAITTGGQMSSEFLGDMEQTLGKGYTDFNPNEKANALTGMLAQTAFGTTLEMAALGKALRPLIRKMKTTGVSSKLLKKAIGKDRGALRELVEAAGAEGLTEAAQGQSLDTLASLLYDEDRELITFDTLKRRTMEFGVGAVVGGTVSGGARVIGGAPSAPSDRKKSDLKKPVQERSELTIPDSVTVTYKPIDGPVKTVSLAIDPGQDPRAAVEAELAGRYDTTYPMEINTVSAPVPIDLPNQAPDATQEQVPVQPEASLIDQSNINRPPVVDQDSMPTLTQEEFDIRLNGQPTPEQVPVGQSLEAGEIAVLSNLGKNNVFFDDKPRNAANLLQFLDQQPGMVPDEMRNNIRARLERLSALDKSVENLSAEEIYNKGIALFESGDFNEREDGAHLLNELEDNNPEGYTVAEAKAKQQLTPEQAPAEQVLPEVVPQVVPATEQAPAVRGNFRISPRMAKSKPRYRGQPVAYGSELELAVYMATGKGKNASRVRSELIEAGYSPAEINAMSKEVRAQMKKGYNPNSSEPISVAIAQDVTAEAAGVDRLSMSFKDVLKRTPEIQEQAKILKENIKAGDRQQSRRVAEVADEFKPVHAYDFVPAPETNSDMRTALKEDQVPFFNAVVPDGKLVAMRLDIPAYKTYGTWIPVIHEPKGNSFQAGNRLSYQSTGVLNNVQLGVAGKGIAALNIATGKDKGTIATIIGTYKKVTPTQAKKMADKALKDPSYVQVGMDPERRGYFYNRETMQEVVAGDQAIQIGPLVLVKNPQYGATPSNEWLSIGPDVVAEAAPLKAKAKKVTRDYDLLSSPFISDYSGAGPTDTSVPDYNDFHYVVSKPQQKELNAAIESGAVDNLADQVANEAAVMMNDPAISAGIGWYGRMRKRLKEIFGDDIDIFTQLLGTTSAQTPVETNFRFSVDLYNRFKAGEFDKKIKKYLQLSGLMKAGTLGDLLLKDKVKNSKGVLYTPEMIKKSEPSALLSSAAEHYKLLPAQTSGKKYGTNSYPALKALSQVWFDERLGKNRMTPKTPQFTMNLNGESLEATIDVWAARLLRRVIYADQGESRILPSEETAVNNPDFALGQLVFRRAAEKLNMNPDDLQALVWFGEKQIWDRNGWTGAAGALKSSFDEPADVFYPVDGSTRTEADAKLILDFLSKERLVKRNIDFPDAVSKASQNKTRKDYDQFLRKSVIADYLEYRGSGAVYESSAVQRTGEQQGESQEDVTAQAAQKSEEESRGPQDTFDNGGQVQDFIDKEFGPLGIAVGAPVVMRMGKIDYVARYNVTQGIIEYNPMELLKRSKDGIQAAMREEIIHAAMHRVLMVKAKKKSSMAEGGKVWTDFFTEFGKSLTAQERADISNVYLSLKPDDYIGIGSEYSRAVVQNLLYGEFSEQYNMESKGGPAWNAIVDLLRSVQAYMAKVLGPMIKTNPEAAQVIVDTVEMLKVADPALRPKRQEVVANAYDAVDENTANESTQGDEKPSKDSSERIREERKWFDGAFRQTASKYLTPVITRLNRINPQIARILQNLDTAIRERSFKYKKQTEVFFSKLNSIKGEDFEELKQLMFFSPKPEDANLPQNKAKIQRRDALLHKYDLLNLYRLDVQPILESIYTEYNELGMPKIGYLSDYFPRVVKDLEGLIKSYGHKTKITFELLVREENERRSKLDEPLAEMGETERAELFQDFMQGKLRLNLKGVKLPGNVKVREINLIPKDKLKFYDEPRSLPSASTLLT